jgi:hypothetical protein
MTYTFTIMLPSGKVAERFTATEPYADTLRLARIVQAMYKDSKLIIKKT